MNVKALPLAGKLGLRNGDVLQTLNGIKVSEVGEAAELIGRFAKLRTFRLGVLRNSGLETLSVTLRD